METTSLSSSLLPFNPFSKQQKISLNHPRRTSLKITASRREERDENYDGRRLVDEDMIVLRKRIHEMEMVERNFEPPAHWMEWEKRCYNTSYDSMVCEAMGLLQWRLMNARPCMSLAVVTLIALSVPTSTALIAFQLMEVMKIFLSGTHS